MSTIQEVKTISNVTHWLTELDQASQEVVNKQMTISQITGHRKLIGSLPESKQEQIEQLNRENWKWYKKGRFRNIKNGVFYPFYSLKKERD